MTPSYDDMLRFMERRAVVAPRDYVIDLDNSIGSFLSTSRGMLLDLACFHGSRLIGYNHPHMKDPAVVERLRVAATTKTSNPDFVTPELYEYYKMLEFVAPRCISNPDMKIMVINSGAEAMENAMKHCIALTGGTKFLSFIGGFHGRTVYALGNSDMPHNRRAQSTFNHLVRASELLPYPTSDANVDDAIRRIEIVLSESSVGGWGGCIIEPIQGAGGHNIVPPRFMTMLSRLLYARRIPLIFDEVQTGGGASGHMWMSDSYTMCEQPECVVGGKRLGCGVVYMRGPESVGLLDTTWGGTLADMVRTCEEIRIVHEESLLDAVEPKHYAFMHGLSLLSRTFSDHVINPRGVGLLLGFNVASRQMRDRLIQACLARDLLVLAAGTHAVRFRPSLGISFTEIEQSLERLEWALADVQGG